VAPGTPDHLGPGSPQVKVKPDPTRGKTPQADGSYKYNDDYNVFYDDMGNITAYFSLDDEKVRLPLVWTVNSDGKPNASGPGGFADPDVAKNELQIWYENDTPQWKQIRKDYLAMGVTGKNDQEIDAKIYRLVSDGIDFTQVPGSGISDPYEYTNTRSGMDILDGNNRGGSGAAYGPYRYESTDVALSSESQALEILDQAYQQYLGRVATGEEAQAFKEALNMMEQMNPAKSVIEGVSGKRSDSRTQTTEGGFNPRAFAREYTMASPEYANTFAATTFMNALNSFLDEPNAVEQRIEGINA
jgi:hypothetical protein